MRKKELIQIRVTEEEKLTVRAMAIRKGMTMSELVLYSLMKVVGEDEIDKK